MLADDFIKLLDCTARFIGYGKPNILAIFNWQKNILFEQNGKTATVLKSYKKWNEDEKKIVSGKGVELDIDGCDEKIRFYDVSQTTAQKYGGKQKNETKTKEKEEPKELEKPTAENIAVAEIGFTHRHRGLLLTAMWQELGIFQTGFEGSGKVTPDELLRHISAVYIIHRHFKSNWQNAADVEAAFNAFCGEHLSGTENDVVGIETYLLGAFFSELYQKAVNLIVEIEMLFETLVNNSESSDAENYYLWDHFYNSAGKEKVAVCRLKASAVIDANLSIDSFEMIETLPYKANMERESFLEYMQSVFDNGLTLEHLVLVCRKNQNGIMTVTVYRIDVCDWSKKLQYVNFETVEINEAKKYYLRPISSETLGSGNADGNDTDGANIEAEKKAKPPPELKPNPKVLHTKDNGDKNYPRSPASSDKSTAAQQIPSKSNSKQNSKKKIDIMKKVSQFKEDMQNKTC